MGRHRLGLCGTVAIVLAIVTGCGRLGFDSMCGLQGPCVFRVAINDGEGYARGPRLSVAVAVSGEGPIELRVAEVAGDCQSDYADDRWQPYVSPETVVRYLVEPTDGTKKLCVWARDASGVSVIDPELVGVNVDTIQYETENLPHVEAFTASIVDAQLQLAWTIADVEGLADRPVELEYTVLDVEEAAWMPLASGLGGAPALRATGTIGLAIPTTEPFFVRLVPRDRAGNRGIPAVSAALNVASWNVYLGSRDRGIGASARAARLHDGRLNLGQHLAIDPATLDVFAVDVDHGIVRIDGATGLVERMFELGANNLPADGPLPERPVVPDRTSVRFGEDGMLYLGVPEASETISGVIYQIDPATRHCRRYLGGGTVSSASATSTTVFLLSTVFDFDEDGSVYFLSACTPGSTTTELRMLKATQLADRSAGAISVVAGNCAPAATLPEGGPYDPLASPMQGFVFAGLGTITAGDHGRLIYFSSYPGTDVWKIVDGVLWSSNIDPGSFGGVAYDDTRDVVYAAAGTSVQAFRPNRAGVTDTLLDTIGTPTNAGQCGADGVRASEACISVDFTMQATPDRLYFVDGARLNQNRLYRVRFVDRGGAVRTYVGAPAFVGAGAHRGAVRGEIAGIAFKSPAAPNQIAFPAGLYFMDWSALLLGHVSSDETVTIDWGNSANVSVQYVTGDAIGADVGLGAAYNAGTRALTFDDQGLPWLHYGADPGTSLFVSVDATRHVVERQRGPTKWESAADGTDPATTELWPYGATTNLAVKGAAAFVLGGYSYYNTTATIRMLDFGATTTRRLMGAGTNGYTADRLTPGTVTTASISSSCMNGNLGCFTFYDPVVDRLYFSENQRLRFITTPSDPATSTLQTLYTEPSGADINNFTLRPDGSQVFYVANGQLRCSNISSAAPACDGRDLGPPALFGPVGRGPNQLTWRDANTLLLSTYANVVLEYTVP